VRAAGNVRQFRHGNSFSVTVLVCSDRSCQGWDSCAVRHAGVLVCQHDPKILHQARASFLLAQGEGAPLLLPPPGSPATAGLSKQA
jgi:hypothetical protein